MGTCNAGSSYFTINHLGNVFRCNCLRENGIPIGHIDDFEPLLFDRDDCSLFSQCSKDYPSDWRRTTHDGKHEVLALQNKTVVQIHPSGMFHFPKQNREEWIQAKRGHLDVGRWISFAQRIKMNCYPCYFVVGGLKDEPTLYDLNLEESMDGNGGSLFRLCSSLVEGPGYLKLISDFSNGVIIDEISRIQARPKIKFTAVMHVNEKDFDFDKFFGRVLMVRHRGYHLEIVIPGIKSQMFMLDYWKSFFSKYQIDVKLVWEPPGNTQRMKLVHGLCEHLDVFSYLS